MKIFYLKCNGKEISWQHLEKFYLQDTATEEGLRLAPKLKYEHIYLTSFSKMRVDLAAQVSSLSCSCYTKAATIYHVL